MRRNFVRSASWSYSNDPSNSAKRVLATDGMRLLPAPTTARLAPRDAKRQKVEGEQKDTAENTILCMVNMVLVWSYTIIVSLGNLREEAR